MPTLYSPVVLLVFRLLVGLLFLFSGLIKINDTIGFAYKLEEYFLVFENHSGIPFTVFNAISHFLAGLISVVECVIAVMLLLGVYRRLTAWLLLIMIVFFTFLTGYSALTGSVTDCGCFGDAIKLTPTQSFYKDLVLLVLIGYLFAYRGRIRTVFSGGIGSLMVVVISTLLFIGLAQNTYRHLPWIDFLPYKVGNNLEQLSREYKPDGSPVLKDYYPTDLDCGQSEFEGKALWIVAYNLEKADPDDLQAATELGRKLMDQGYFVYLGTSSGSEVRQEYQKAYDMPFCLVARDAVMLKSVLRANPGFVLLQEGVVVEKWHANDLPDVEEIQEELSEYQQGED